MSLLTNQTSLNGSEFFFLRGTGQQINVSTLNANTISTNAITANSSIANQLSTILLDANDINASTIFAYEVFIDNQGLTATPTELLLNGIPLATISNLSTIADWALDPAISSVNMNGFDLLSTNNVKAQNVSAQNGMFQNLMVQNVFAVSTYTSTISSLAEVAQFGFIDTLSTGTTSAGILNASTFKASTIDASACVVNSLQVYNTICTPSLYVSSINGAEFTSTTLTIEVAGVSSLVANSISSVGAEIRQALVSSIQFKPEFDINFNFDLEPVGQGIKSGLTNLGIGIGTGLVAIGSGIAAAATARKSNTTIVQNTFEQYSMPTQLQFSTLGEITSSYTRLVSSSGAGNEIPGVEYLTSTIIPAGTLCVRSLGDPVNLVDPSTYTSSIQTFGQWVIHPEIPTSTFQTLQTSTLSASTITLEGQMIINPSTTRSGVYMPYDATNGTGVVAVGLSTSASIYEKYAALLALSALPIGGVAEEMAAFLQTDNNELSFEYADVQVGRLLVGGNYSYSLNPTAYLDGDQAGNLTAAALSFNTSNAVVSSLKLSPSSILYSQSTDAEVVCGTASDPNDLAQIAASAVRLASSIAGSNGILTYNQTTDRLTFVDSTATPHTLAYTTDITSSFTNLYTQYLDVSTINLPTGPGGISGDDAYTSIQGINNIVAKNVEFSTIQGEGGGNLTIITPVSAVSLSTPEVVVSSVIGSDIKISGTSVDLLASAGGSSHVNANFIALLAGGSGENSIQLQGNLSTISAYAEQSIIVGAGTAGPNPSAFISLSAPAIEIQGLSSINGYQYPGYFYSAYSSTSQAVAGANVSTLVQYDEATTNIGGYTFGVDTIEVPAPGTYELTASFQFATSSGGTKKAQFWLVKNGAAVEQTNSIVSIVNNGDTLGSISVIDTAAAAGDKYGWMFYSSDANMTASAVAPGATPGVPAVIVSAKRLA